MPKIVRCPLCKGLKLKIDRFDHSKFMVCLKCRGKYKAIEITELGDKKPVYLPGDGVDNA